MIYAFSVALKSYTVWLESGTAGYYALMIDQFATPAGKKLLACPELLSALTRAAYLLEAGCVAAALSPVGTRHIRRVLVPVMMCLHLGFGLCMELGLFSLVMCTAWIPFLPGRNRPAAVSGPPTAVPAGTGTRAARTAAGTVVLLCLAYVYLWNLRTTDFDRYEKMFPRAWNAPARLLGLSQHWKLFAPHPSLNDGWLVIPATLVDGSKVDLFRGGLPVDWNKPETVSALYPNQRWRKYLMNLQKERHRRHCQTYAQHLTRQWNDAQPAGRQLVRFSIVLVRERTLDGGRTAPLEYDELWRHFGPAYAP